MRFRLFCIGLAFTASFAARAADASHPLVFESRATQVPVVELYTSEGCSSCPPADRWLSSLTESGAALWSDVVPLAFHVTYWDRLGWPDRFARPEYDLRQARLAAQAGAVVYTPGVFLNGTEYRAWRFGAERHLDPGKAKPGVLRVALEGNVAMVRFDAVGDRPADLQVSLAWLQMNQRTEVRRGENRGRQLRHDFVVAAMQTQTLINADTAKFVLTGKERTVADAVAVFVTDADGVPLQATGGWIRGS